MMAHPKGSNTTTATTTPKDKYAAKPTKAELKLGAPHGGPALAKWRRANAGKKGVHGSSQADAYKRNEIVYSDQALRQLWRGQTLGVYSAEDRPTPAQIQQGYIIPSSILNKQRINVQGKPLTAGQFANFVYQLDPNNGDLDSWKQKLYAAGFYSDDVYRAGNGLPGGLDPDTIAAWNKAVAVALSTKGKSIKDIIEERIPQYSGYLKKLEASGGGPPPLVVDLTNPSTLRAFLNQAAQTLTGRDATDQEVQAFVANYQAEEKAFQTERHAGQVGGGSTQEEPPVPQAAAEEFIREKAPVEFGSHRVAETSANFLRIITENSIPTATVE